MSNFETRTGLVIAVFAAFMAVSDLFAGKYGDDEIILTNDKAAAYQWYQSKSIKQSLFEGESSLLQSLQEHDAIKTESQKGIQSHIEKLNAKVAKYEKEKKEILLGSQGVGQENWIQDVDGELGKVIGAKEIESQLVQLSQAGDKFDMASLFYQLCLVLGAISLVIKNEKMQKFFFYQMTGLGVCGVAFTIWAFFIVGIF